jgi:RNA polymerase sigma factor (sigma-70 family)
MPPPPAELFASRVLLGPALRAQPDRRLVDLVRDGYDAAFEEIVRRYRKPLDRFAAGIVGGRSEDVTQDAFSKALLALRGSGAEIELRPWLYRIVRNTALNDLRDRAPATEELSERLPGARSAAAEVETREELRDLMDRLQALPEPQRAALVMRELEGLSHEEIAAALGVSGGAARQAIYRARAALREGMGLLVPLPLLRALAEYGADAGRAGGAIAAGAGASSAGGAALGGGALKLGMATVLVAGTVGAGVAIKDHRVDKPDPSAGAPTPLIVGKEPRSEASETSGDNSDSSGTDDRGHGGDGKGHGSKENGSGSGKSGDSPNSGTGGGSGSSRGPGPSVSGGGSDSSEGSGPSEGSRHSGSGSSGSGGDSSGSGSSGRGRGEGGSDGGGSSADSGGDGGGSGGPGGGDLVSGSDDGSGSSPGGGEVEAEAPGEPALGETENGSGSGDSGSDGGGSGSGGGSSGDGTTTSGSDGSS